MLMRKIVRVVLKLLVLVVIVLTPYLPPQWAQAREQDRGALGTLLTQSYTSIHPHAVENAPLAAQSARYPVFIFEKGYLFRKAFHCLLAIERNYHRFCERNTK